MPIGVLIDGPALRQARIARQMTGDQLADQAGVNRNTLYRAESGLSTSFETLHALARVLGYPAVRRLIPDTETRRHFVDPGN